MLLACGFLAACDNTATSASVGSPTDSQVQTVQGDLPGSWLREYQERGIRVRRLLMLDADGQFSEQVRITDASGAVTEQTHSGTWLYDATNLKRKYTRMNGQPPSRLNLPFAAFELRFLSKNEFLGLDRVHGNEVRYRRVQPETAL